MTPVCKAGLWRSPLRPQPKRRSSTSAWVRRSSSHRPRNLGDGMARCPLRQPFDRPQAPQSDQIFVAFSAPLSSAATRPLRPFRLCFRTTYGSRAFDLGGQLRCLFAPSAAHIEDAVLEEVAMLLRLAFKSKLTLTQRL